MSAIESHNQHHRPEDGGSDRSFGLLFCAVFVVIGLWPLWQHQRIRWWALGLGLAFGATAFVAPHVLMPLKRLWMKFGWLLGNLVSPLVMAVLLYAVVTPVGLVQRLFGRDPLQLALDRKAKTYWQFRTPPGPKPGSMTNQF